MAKLVPLHEFKPKQKVTTRIKATGQVLEGIITDSICDPTYKFDKMPLKYRKLIPVKWNNGKYGAIPFTELKIKK